jgi:KUP system potassium uptake protein
MDRYRSALPAEAAHTDRAPIPGQPTQSALHRAPPAAGSDTGPEPLATSGSGTSRRWRDSLALTALGIVYGDIGTSPIYTMNVVFSRNGGIAASDSNVLGVLSLIFWALLLVVTIKYMTLVLKASHEGDGGVIALATLLVRSLGKGRRRWLLAGVAASALLIGDGMLTPAISVLSAVQGLEMFSPELAHLVPVLTAAILILLFAIQRRGTAAIGGLFGPFMLLWFVGIAVMGILWVLRMPTVLWAMSPTYALRLLSTGGWSAFFVLGSVFLVVTGSEALYADLGHFGLAPIRRSWYWLVWPALTLSYFGQGALLLSHPDHPGNTFFALVPPHLLAPLILLAAVATLIASQAVITGSYSLLKQLAELDYFPHLRLRHTSALQSGRIYVPAANWLLMGGTLLLVVIFRSSDELASAYGLAIGGVALITSVLFLQYFRRVRGRSFLATAALGTLFIGIDGAFFVALLAKLLSGALVIFVISALLLGLMLIWRWGQDRVRRQRRLLSPGVEAFLSSETMAAAKVVPGTALFFSKEPGHLPAGLMQNLRHNQVLHRESYLLYLEVQDRPRVRLEEKLAIDKLGAGFFLVACRFGYMETPRFDTILTLLEDSGYPLATENLSVFVSHARFRYRALKGPRSWRAKIYAFLERNSPGPALVLDIPEEVLIEIGVQFEL